jgi:hypothetical protein
MAVTINADNGAVSGSAGLKQAADSTGILALQTNGTTAISVDASQVVTLTNALAVASGGTGTTSTTFANLTTNVTGTLPVANGGTGTTSTTFVNLASNVTGTLPVANGGTGVTSSTGSGSVVLGTSPSISGAVLSSMASSVITSGTLVTASGTSVNFTSLPSWVKRITVMLVGISSNGGSMPTVRIGDSGGISASGYLGSVMCGSAATLFTTGFEYGGGLQSATRVWHGAITINLQNSSTNTWAATGVISLSDGASTVVTAGSKSLTSALTQVRVTYVNGTDSFDAGSINILYE